MTYGAATGNGTATVVPRVREQWAREETALGCMCMLSSPLALELVVGAGYDWVCIDTQHGLISYDQMLGMLQAVGHKVTTFVRVQWNEPSAIMRALDAGADGVIVPMVNTAAEAEAAARACRYPPHGYRSWGPVRTTIGVPGFGPRTEDGRVICAVMIETEEAVGNVDEILAVPGVDVAFVGPSDLSLSLTGGLGAPDDDPRHPQMITAVLESCARHDVVPGIALVGSERSRHWRDAGFRMVGVHNDAGLLATAAREMLDATGRPAAA